MTGPVGSVAGSSDVAQVDVWPLGKVFRDITLGGVAGLLVGIVVGGLGGRVAMRLAALIVPDAVGSTTQNGNRIGDITLGGSLGLTVAAGLFAGVFVGTIWVAVRPWLPESLPLRAIAAIPLAIGLGSFGLIEADNPDFIILGHDLLVVAVLLALVGLVGPAMALVEAWLDRHLPWPESDRDRGAAVYAGISVIGLFLVLPLVALTYVSTLWPAGVALIVTGLATTYWWLLRYRGAERPPTSVRVVGSVGLVAATVLGLSLVAPDIRDALGLG